jgi:dTDP-4-dehydrorhamnose reductase
MEPVELWGGIECTVNRVHNDYSDQCVLSGHLERASDLDLIAGLGIKSLRYPVLWEKISPHAADECDWIWADERLAHLRKLGIKPIVGLIHHGSGPSYTDLLDKEFAPGLASHARRVAERYDWISDWTPVNEPLTTARFSALYGHWYPHLRNERAFWLALLNQIDAVRLSMKEIRRINSKARLIQTDDLGRVYAVKALEEQAAFDNTRRWMSWDLLCGLVNRHHPFWKRLVGFGLERRLAEIADDPCTPDVVGINHYLTSDRFLDTRLDRYPAHCIGGNGRQRYADVEAIRVVAPPPAGLEGALREAWQRYRIPLAITEIHNGCTREEQMRWLAEAWQTANDVRSDGVDIRAVTSWALLGSKGWNTLLTGGGHYEPGVFDVRNGRPRETRLAGMLRDIAGKGSHKHPVLSGHGWWRRPSRLIYPEASRPGPLKDHLSPPRWHKDERPPPLLITGATGTLGQAFARACQHRNIAYVLTSRDELDLEDEENIAAVIKLHRPWAVVNAAGWVRVDEAEGARDGCFRANFHGAVALARSCNAVNIPTISFSSDLVFDGASSALYVESDRTAPLSVYGRSKAECEHALARLGGPHLVIRTAAFFSPHDVHNFAVHTLRALRDQCRFPAVADHIISPTYVPDLVDVSLDLLIDRAHGVWHLTHGEGLTWSDFAMAIGEAHNLDTSLIERVKGSSVGWAAPRPIYSALGSERGAMLPKLEDAIRRFAGSAALEQPAKLMSVAA